jgi:hypothetical protein
MKIVTDVQFLVQNCRGPSVLGGVLGNFEGEQPDGLFLKVWPSCAAAKKRSDDQFGRSISI